MNKRIGILCSLTVLSACNTLDSLAFWRDDEQKVTAPRHAPVLNNTSERSNAPIMPNPALTAQSPYSSMPTPPANDGFMPMPPSLAAQGSNVPYPPMPDANANPIVVGNNTALPSGRRTPEGNRDALGQSGDLVGSSPVAGVSQMSLTPPVPPTPGSDIAMPGGSLIPPPPPVIKPIIQEKQVAANDAPVMPAAPTIPAAPNFVDAPAAPLPVPAAQAKLPEPPKPEEFPKLAEVPPAPVMPATPANDPRISQMKQDMASMDQQTSEFKRASGETVAVKTVGGSTNPVPIVEKQIARPPMPPEPPAMMPEPQAQPQQMAMAPMPPQAPNMGVMPEGPSIVVRSKRSGMAPETINNPPAAQMSAPMMAPPPPMQMQEPMMANNQPAAPAPTLGKKPAVLGRTKPTTMASTNVNDLRPLSDNSQSTEVADLRPIPVEPVNTYSASIDAPSGYTDVNTLKPIATNQHRQLLPNSRYARMREASRNGGGNNSY